MDPIITTSLLMNTTAFITGIYLSLMLVAFIILVAFMIP